MGAVIGTMWKRITSCFGKVLPRNRRKNRKQDSKGKEDMQQEQGKMREGTTVEVKEVAKDEVKDVTEAEKKRRQVEEENERREKEREKEKETKEQEREREQDDVALDNLVELYLGNSMINMTLIPDFIERHFYRTILRMVLRKFEQSTEDVEIALLGHTLQIHTERGRLARGLFERCRRQNEERKKEEEKEKEKGEKGEREGIEPLRSRDDLSRLKKSPEQAALQVRVIEHLVQKFVDANVTSDDAPPLFGFITGYFERALYTNALHLVLGIVQDTLHTSSVDFLGHRLMFRFAAVPSLLYDDPDGNKQSANDEGANDNGANDEGANDGSVDDESVRATRRVIEDIVEEHMAENNIFLVPDFVERHLYTRALGILIGALYECLDTLKVSMMHQSITVSIKPRA